MLILLYLTMLIAAAMKKDFEEQGILTEDSLLGLDTTNKNTGKAPAPNPSTDPVSLLSEEGSLRASQSEGKGPTNNKAPSSIVKSRGQMKF